MGVHWLLNDEAIPWDTRIRLLELLELYRRPLDESDSEKATLPAGEQSRKDDKNGAPGPSGSKKKMKAAVAAKEKIRRHSPAAAQSESRRDEGETTGRKRKKKKRNALFRR